MPTTEQKFEFRKGQKLHLDDIYDIQGLAEGDWWEVDYTDPGNNGDENGDFIVITKSIDITIRAKTFD